MPSPPPLSPMLEELATLRATNRMLRLVMHHLPDTLGGAYDVSGNLIVLLGPTAEMASVTAREGEHYLKFVPPERKEKFLWLFNRAKGGLEVSDDYPIGDKIFEATSRPVFDEKEVIHAILIYVRDVTAERMAQEALRKKARDTLTGLPKRSVLHAFVDGLISRGTIFHVLYVDLDNFKQVNDRVNHAEGDKLLERVSNELRSAVRANDLAVRMGGDEFVVVLTNTNAPIDAAKRILQRVLMVTVPFGAGASMGLASYPVDGTSMDAVLKAADEALITSKKAGKGRLSGSSSGTFEVHLPPTAPPPSNSVMETLTAPPPKK